MSGFDWITWLGDIRERLDGRPESLPSPDPANRGTVALAYHADALRGYAEFVTLGAPYESFDVEVAPGIVTTLGDLRIYLKEKR